MHKRSLERRQWVSIKHKYLFTDATYDRLAAEYGVSRQGILYGLRREFPKTDFKARKIEETSRRKANKLAKVEEKGLISKLSFDNATDAMDEKHLSIINLALDDAMVSLQSGNLKAKDIKDIKELINLERLIADKRTTNDRVIVVRAEKPEDYSELPEVIDGEFEVEDAPR